MVDSDSDAFLGEEEYTGDAVIHVPAMDDIISDEEWCNMSPQDRILATVSYLALIKVLLEQP